MARDGNAKVGRRRALELAGAGALALGGGILLEYMSLSGRFDHHRAPPWPVSSRSRYAAALAELERSAAASDASIVHVAHSTHLVALAGLRFLTDPWFFDPAFGALEHEIAPAVPPEDLGRLDVVLVTHDHADHADLRAMDRMDKRARVVVATEGLASKVRRIGFGEVHVLAPWETLRVGAVDIVAVPALHDIYEVGFVLRSAGRSVYFAGDTRLHPDLPAIAERFRPDVSILPVDGTRISGDPLYVMTPDDAAEAAKILGSKLVLPSHAEARFSDPLAEHVLASTVAGARGKFRDAVARLLPAVRCAVPEAGELVSM